jgi:hypothetical protein
MLKHYSQILFFTYYNILKHLQLNILHLCLNVFVIFAHLLNYQHFYMSRIIHFELIENTIQTLYIAFTNIY